MRMRVHAQGVSKIHVLSPVWRLVDNFNIVFFILKKNDQFGRRFGRRNISIFNVKYPINQAPN